MVLLSVRAGIGVMSISGATAGGTATVGNRELRSMVAVGWRGAIGVGEEVAVGKNGSSVGTSMEYSEVGVACEICGGWKGVGVGEAFGAAVTKMKGTRAFDGAVLQDVNRKARMSARRGYEIFIWMVCRFAGNERR